MWGAKGSSSESGHHGGIAGNEGLQKPRQGASAATALKSRPHPLGQASDWQITVLSDLPPWPYRS